MQYSYCLHETSWLCQLNMIAHVHWKQLVFYSDVNKQMYYTWLCVVDVSTPLYILQRGNITYHASWVWGHPYYLENKPYIPYVVGVESENLCKRQHYFLVHPWSFETPMWKTWVWAHPWCTNRYIDWNVWIKIMGVVTPIMHGVYGDG